MESVLSKNRVGRPLVPAPPTGSVRPEVDGPASPTGSVRSEVDGPAPPTGSVRSEVDGPAPPTGSVRSEVDGPASPTGSVRSEVDGPPLVEAHSGGGGEVVPEDCSRRCVHAALGQWARE